MAEASNGSDDKGSSMPSVEGNDLSPWIKAIAVVTFDVELGQVMELAYPPATLSEGVRKKVCCLSLPDSNSGQNGDVQFSMRVRCSDLPLSSAGTATASSAPIEDSYLYASVFFRQIIDSSLQRGYFQKSVVLLSHHPFNNLLHECARVVGPLYFEFGEEVLDAVSANIRNWPALQDGYAYELPLAGTIINFRVPTGALRPSNSNNTIINNNDNNSSASVDDQTTNSRIKTDMHKQTEIANKHRDGKNMDRDGSTTGGETNNSGAGKWIRRRSDSLRSSSSVMSAPIVENGGTRMSDLDDTDDNVTEEESSEDNNNNNNNIIYSHHHSPTDLSVDTGHHLNGDDHIPGNERRKEEERREKEKEKRAEKAQGNSINRSVNPSERENEGNGAVGVAGAGEVKLREGEFSISDIFDARANESPGLFQEVRLFSTFGGLSVALWHIWELAITGEPIIVLAPTPDSCSQAVLAVASLVAPMVYQGDFRPYFTIYDPDFKAISKRHNQLRGQQMPPCVLGVTNPYFLKAFEFWPNVIAMGGTSPKPSAITNVGKINTTDAATAVQGSGSASPVNNSRTHGMGVRRRHEFVASADIGSSGSVKGTSIKTAKYHPTVAKRGASLNALLTDQRYEHSTILTRNEPLVPPDKAILRRLVVHRPTYETRQAAGQAAAAGLQWESPAVSINNAVLRQHFRSLTNAFLRPLDQYFKLAAVGSRASRVHQGISVSAYSEPPRGLFEIFDEEEFMQMLETQQPAKPIQRFRWRVLYRRFIHGPNFWPWFHSRRLQLVGQLAVIYRHLRLNTDSETLLRSVSRGSTSAPALVGSFECGASTSNTVSASAASESAYTVAQDISGSSLRGQSGVVTERGGAEGIWTREGGAVRSRLAAAVGNSDGDSNGYIGGDDVVLSTSHEEGGGGSGGVYENEQDKLCLELYLQVKRALNVELAKTPRDLELCNKMREHLHAVLSALQRTNYGGKTV